MRNYNEMESQLFYYEELLDFLDDHLPNLSELISLFDEQRESEDE